MLKHLANAEVGVAGTVQPGIFKKPYQVVHLGSGMADSRPTVALDSAVLPEDPYGLALLVDGAAYRVVEHQPDGTGMTCLFLEFA